VAANRSNRHVHLGAGACYCPTLTLANHGDWRSRRESSWCPSWTWGDQWSNDKQYAFPSTPTAVFWSASPVAGLPADAYIVDFFNGYTGYYIITGTNDVRCVR